MPGGDGFATAVELDLKADRVGSVCLRHAVDRLEVGLRDGEDGEGIVEPGQRHALDAAVGPLAQQKGAGTLLQAISASNSPSVSESAR